MISFFRFISIILFSFLVTPLYAASFDCNKATTETEKAICTDPELSALDEFLGITWEKYKIRITNNTEIKFGSITKNPPIKIEDAKTAQRDWIEERNKCSNEECLKSEYKNRLVSLSNTHFRGSGNTGHSNYRRYFNKTENVCRPSELSVDAFFDEGLNLCYEIIPNMRFVEFIVSDGHLWLSYYELSRGYFDCYFSAIFKKSESNSDYIWQGTSAYRGFDGSDDIISREDLSTDKGNYLSFDLNDGIEFKGMSNCGMKNIGLSGFGFGS